MPAPPRLSPPSPCRAFSARRASDHNLQIALIGCGGRGTGAVVDALTAASYPTKLVAMADVFQHRLDESYDALEQQYQSNPISFDVPEDKRFIGFDAYKKAMDCLRPGDIAILATPLAFRWVHFQYAIDAASTSSWRSRSLPTA